MSDKIERSQPSEGGVSEQILIDAITAAIDYSSASYVAGPLATGITYYNRLAMGEPDPVVRPENERLMRAAVRILRGKNLIVIDPSTLKIPNWSPTRVGNFYIEVLRLFARELRFMPGWEYSSGATKEYAFAIKYGKPTLDLEGNEITRPNAAEMVKSAALRLDNLGVASHKLHIRWESIVNSERETTLNITTHYTSGERKEGPLIDPQLG